MKNKKLIIIGVIALAALCAVAAPYFIKTFLNSDDDEKYENGRISLSYDTRLALYEMADEENFGITLVSAGSDPESIPRIEILSSSAKALCESDSAEIDFEGECARVAAGIYSFSEVIPEIEFYDTTVNKDLDKAAYCFSSAARIDAIDYLPEMCIEFTLLADKDGEGCLIVAMYQKALDEESVEILENVVRSVTLK